MFFFSPSPSPLELDSLSFLSPITKPQTQSATLPSLKNNCFSTSKQQGLTLKMKKHGKPWVRDKVECIVQWNLDLTKCQETGEICSLNRGFVISNIFTWRIFGKTTKMFVILRYREWLIYKIQHFRIWSAWDLIVITFQYRAINSYGTRNSRTGKQNCLNLRYT